MLESAEKVVILMQNGCSAGKIASCIYIRMTYCQLVVSLFPSEILKPNAV